MVQYVKSTKDGDKKMFKEFIKTYWMLLLSAVIIICLFKTVFMMVAIPSESMENTLHIGDIVIAYRMTEYRRGDIVAFKDPENNRRFLCKRIIAVGGDHVEITSEHVYINGKALDEPYLKENNIELGLRDYGIVPDGCYFMLGDNRNNSRDSRFWDDPFIDGKSVKAKLLVGIAPIKVLYK